jgi:hypothetical protein
MASLTVDRVLTEAEALTADEQEMLESLLRRRRIETWRQETAAEARSAIRAFRSGKLKTNRSFELLLFLLFAWLPCGFGQTEVGAVDPRVVVSNAIQRLAAAPDYSWHQTFELPGGYRGTPAEPLDGKARSDGLSWTSQGNIEKFTKGLKRAVKEQTRNWEDPEERFPARVIRIGPYGPVTPPVWQLTNILDKVQNLKKSDGYYVGDLQPADAKTLVIYGGSRAGGGGDGTRSASPVSAAAVSFWVEDGALSKYSTRVTVHFTDNGAPIENTQVTTVEIKDVGTTKMDVPDEVKIILGL